MLARSFEAVVGKAGLLSSVRTSIFFSVRTFPFGPGPCRSCACIVIAADATGRFPTRCAQIRTFLKILAARCHPATSWLGAAEHVAHDHLFAPQPARHVVGLFAALGWRVVVVPAEDQPV